MNTVLLVLRAALAVVFATAGIAKLSNLALSRQTMAGFGVSDRLAQAGGTLLPFAELATALALLIQPTARWGALGAVLLLLVFVAGITNALPSVAKQRRLTARPRCATRATGWR